MRKSDKVLLAVTRLPEMTVFTTKDIYELVPDLKTQSSTGSVHRILQNLSRYGFIEKIGKGINTSTAWRVCPSEKPLISLSQESAPTLESGTDKKE